jgi:hypothetical protein
MRTALNAIVTGIFIYRVFYHDFAPIAFAYIILGILILCVSAARRFRIFKSMWKLLHHRSEPQEEQVMLFPPPPTDPSAMEMQPLNVNRPIPVTAPPDMQQVPKMVVKDGLRVTVPLDPPKQQLSHPYFEWRQTLKRPPVAPYFETSGGTALLLTVLIFGTEIVVLILLARI